MRQDPQARAGERDVLAQYLDYQRETILLKADGLRAPETMTVRQRDPGRLQVVTGWTRNLTEPASWLRYRASARYRSYLVSRRR